MKKTLKIIGLTLVGLIVFFLLIGVIGAAFSSSDSDMPTAEQIESLERELKFGDSIRIVKQRIEDSITIADEKARAVKKEKALTLLKSFRSSKDDFSESTFYRSPQSPRYTNTNFIYPYIGENNGNYWLRVKFQYAADSWLFIKGIKIKTDNSQYDLNLTFERDNDSDIWEWADVLVTPRIRKILEDMAHSSEVLIRYEGMQYVKDRKLTNKEKQVIMKTIEIFSELE